LIPTPRQSTNTNFIKEKANDTKLLNNRNGNLICRCPSPVAQNN